MFYVKVLFGFLWFLYSCVAGLVMALLRYGDVSNGHRMARLFAQGALPIMGVRVAAAGAEKIPASQPCVYVANHQSDLDILAFAGLYPPRTIVIGKKEIVKIPFFGLFFKASGNVLLDREDHERAMAGMGKAADRIRREGVSVWVFPEGHRNPQGPMLPFKKGAFHLAIEAAVPVVPIVCAPISPVLDLGKRRAPGGTLHVQVLDPIGPDGHTADTLLAATVAAMRPVHTELHGLPASS
ncbi:MAG: lysophospholipid acyltransferase family protein [Candidatus Xenobia bacterium]